MRAPWSPRSRCCRACLEGAEVDALVRVQEGSDVLRYEYRVRHSGLSLGIDRFSVAIGSDPTRAVLSSAGLHFASPLLDEMAEMNLSELGRQRAVAIGSDDPRGWQSVALLREGPRIIWMATSDAEKIDPGESRVFPALSRGLPGIREAIIEPDVFDLIPPLDAMPDADEEDVIAARQKTWQRASTLGPKAPPAAFTPVGFLGEIDALREPAVANRWIDSARTSRAIGLALRAVRDELQAGDTAGAIDALDQAIATVDSMSCKQYSCSPSKALSSEAFALFSVNLRYLRGTLPGYPPESNGYK